MTPDGLSKRAAGAKGVRVGHHAFDRSYVQFYLGPAFGAAANVSIDYSVSGQNHSELSLLASPVSCGNCSDFELVVSPRFAFWKAGNVSAVGSGLTFKAAGLDSFAVHATAGGVAR
jgi:hypothetical protein